MPRSTPGWASFIVSDSNQQALPASIAEAISGTEGVGSVVAFGVVQAKYDGRFVTGQSAVGTGLGDRLHLPMLDGHRRRYPATASWCRDMGAGQGWKRGEVLTFSTIGGKDVHVRVAGVFEDNPLVQSWSLVPTPIASWSRHRCG